MDYENRAASLPDSAYSWDETATERWAITTNLNPNRRRLPNYVAGLQSIVQVVSGSFEVASVGPPRTTRTISATDQDPKQSPIVVSLLLHANPQESCLEVLLRYDPVAFNEGNRAKSKQEWQRTDQLHRASLFFPCWSPKQSTDETYLRVPTDSDGPLHRIYGRSHDFSESLSDLRIIEDPPGSTWTWSSYRVQTLRIHTDVSNRTGAIRDAFALFREVASEPTKFRFTFRTKDIQHMRPDYINLFCARPNPSPPTWFAFAAPPNQDAPVINFSQFPSDRHLVEYGYSRRAHVVGLSPLEVRTPPREEPRNTIPFASLPARTYFLDGRAYQTFILGGLHAEHVHARLTTNTRFNGVYTALMLQSPAISPTSTQHAALLGLRVNESLIDSADPDGMLPEEGTNVVAEKDKMSYTGTVVQIPSALSALDRSINLAVQMRFPSESTGMVVSGSGVPFRAEFVFGYAGSPTKSVARHLSRLFNSSETNLNLSSRRIRALLLSTENEQLNRERPSSLHPNQTNIVRTHIAQTRPQLNYEQRQAVGNGLVDMVCTVVRAPPGTGKTTILSVMAAIAVDMHEPFLIFAGSNRAVEEAGNLVFARLGQSVGPRPTQQRTVTLSQEYPIREPIRIGPFRLRSTIHEDQPEGNESSHVIHGDFDPLEVIRPSIMSAEDFRRHLERMLPFKNETHPANSLDAWIEQRMDDLMKCRANGFEMLEDDGCNGEVMMLDALRVLRLAWSDFRYDSKWSRNKLDSEIKRQELQIKRLYASACKGILVTAASSASSILSSFKPHIIIGDELSQMREAEAISPLVRFSEYACRVILIGDHLQLAPTVLNGNDVFREQSAMSLLERLMETGLHTVVLRLQYRMHPEISEFPRTTLYVNTMEDSDIVLKNPLIPVWLGVERALAYALGHNATGAHTLVLSPKRTPEDSLHWGSQMKYGRSRFNVMTAIMSYLTVGVLVEHGFRPRDIGLYTPYVGQLNLLRILIQANPRLRDTHNDDLVLIELKTADASQGAEKQVTILDLVRLGYAEAGRVGFLSDARRFNVASTRAKVARIVVGSKNMIDEKLKEPSQGMKNLRIFFEQHERRRRIHEFSEHSMTRMANRSAFAAHGSMWQTVLDFARA